MNILNLKLQKEFQLNHRRIPGSIILDILIKVLSKDFGMKWVLYVDNVAHEVSALCFNKVGDEQKLISGVTLKVVEKVNPAERMTHITVELSVPRIKLLSGRKIVADFEKIAGEISKEIEKLPMKITAFEHPELAVHKAS